MNTFIAGLLPPANVAARLIAYVEKDCPALVTRMRASIPQATRLDPSDIGCTPFEWVQLQQAGFEPQAATRFGANMAALLAGVKDGPDPIYLAELTSVHVGRDRLSMCHPSMLEVSQSECDALFESVSMLWDDTGLSALPINARHWRVWLPTAVSLDSITPSAVSNYNITDWWPQDPSLRNWRKLVNEIQMVWHEHPINEQRVELGQPPINSVWLFGGATPHTHVTKPNTNLQSPIIDTLAVAHATHEWAQWIAGLADVDKKIQSLPSNCNINLIGYDRMITLTPAPTQWWHKVIRPRPTDWKSWWINPN